MHSDDRKTQIAKGSRTPPPVSVLVTSNLFVQLCIDKYESNIDNFSSNKSDFPLSLK